MSYLTTLWKGFSNTLLSVALAATANPQALAQSKYFALEHELSQLNHITCPITTDKGNTTTLHLEAKKNHEEYTLAVYVDDDHILDERVQNISPHHGERTTTLRALIDGTKKRGFALIDNLNFPSPRCIVHLATSESITRPYIDLVSNQEVPHTIKQITDHLSTLSPYQQLTALILGETQRTRPTFESGLPCPDLTRLAFGVVIYTKEPNGLETGFWYCYSHRSLPFDLALYYPQPPRISQDELDNLVVLLSLVDLIAKKKTPPLAIAILHDETLRDHSQTITQLNRQLAQELTAGHTYQGTSEELEWNQPFGFETLAQALEHYSTTH